MIIECPTCHTHYDVGNSVPPEGRNVRCAACNDVWLVQPELVSVSTPQTSYDNSIISSQEIDPSNDLSNGSLNVAPESDKAEAQNTINQPEFDSDYESCERITPSPDIDRKQYFDEVPDTSMGNTEATAKNFEQHFEQPITNGYSNGTSTGHSEISNGHDLNPGRPDPTSIGNRIEEAIGNAPDDAGITEPAPLGISYVKIISWLTVISVILGILLFALTNPDTTARALPSTVGFFDALGIKTNSRGLEISGVKYNHVTFENRPALSVSGIIQNVTDAPLKVPTVIVELRDKDELILFIWATTIKQNKLDASAQAPFNVTIPAPTKLVKNLKIRFSTRP